MELQHAYKGAKIIETIENFSIADEYTLSEDEGSNDYNRRYYEDEIFWKSTIRLQDKAWGAEISLDNFVISEWVARVPGLYWTLSSQLLRRHTDSDIALQSEDWVKFHPHAKSRKVLGGVGTLLLPPTDEGKVLMSLTSCYNASTGIPALIYPEVLDALKIKQGSSVSIKKARWRPMGVQWSKQFGSSKEVPRGYLVIDEVKKIEVNRGSYPIVYHPFSIMEYERGDALLYDFVYVTADSQVDDVNTKVEKFFTDYKKELGRNGKYLLNPNMVQPIFESNYNSPSELRTPSERAKLDLLYQRVRDIHFGDVGINLLIGELPKYYQSSIAIRSLATRIGLSPSLLAEDSAASMSAQLISLCIEREITEQLIDRLGHEYPTIFIQ